MENELGAKIMRKCVGLRAKAYNYLKDNSLEDKKAKDTKHFVIKKLNFEIIKAACRQLKMKIK